MLRDLNFYDALPFKRMMSFDNESNLYQAQNMDLTFCIGQGKTAEEAQQNLDVRQRALLSDMIRFKLPIPLPKQSGTEVICENVWNASEKSLREACDALAIKLPIDPKTTMLTLVKSIAAYASKPKNAKRLATLLKGGSDAEPTSV